MKRLAKELAKERAANAATHAAHEATLAHAREIVTDLVMAKQAAERKALAAGEARSNGLLNREQRPAMQARVAVAYEEIGANCSDDQLVAYLKARFDVRRDNVLRGRRAYDEFLRRRSLDV